MGGDNMNCSIKSMYICVKDMERAVRFYENFFEKKVTKLDKIYSVFEINGFRFGLFAYEEMNEKHTFGSNCIPSVEVQSLEILKEKIEDYNIIFPITQIGDNYVAEFEDSEGNHIEITSPTRNSIDDDKIMSLLKDILNNTKDDIKLRSNSFIESERIKIRPLKLEELRDITFKDFDELKINIEKESLLSSTKSAISKKVIKMEEVNKSFHEWYTYWLIIDKGTGKGIGFIGFKGTPDEKGYVEVGYSISRLYRNKGLMTEAMKAMAEWAKGEKSCKGIIAYALASNTASHKVLLKCGFKESSIDEGIKLFKIQF